ANGRREAVANDDEVVVGVEGKLVRVERPLCQGRGREQVLREQAGCREEGHTESTDKRSAARSNQVTVHQALASGDCWRGAEPNSGDRDETEWVGGGDRVRCWIHTVLTSRPRRRSSTGGACTKRERLSLPRQFIARPCISQSDQPEEAE